MKTLPKMLICVLVLYACSTADSFQSGEFANADSDPSLYFSRRSGPPLRAAVITFTAAEGGTAYFDAFVTDEVIRRLSSAKNLTLVERSRIALVIQEHELLQTGLVAGRDATRLGTLLAADRLVTGTYAYRNETIYVRGRVLDAKTAKVENVFAFPIPFRGAKITVPSGDAVKPDKGCEDIQRPVIMALRDLSTPAAVERAVDRAIAVPWKKPCGRIHLKVSSDFSYTKLYPRRYNEFLARTLETMEDPKDEYSTVREIFSYFARDGVITEFEWAAARETLKRGWHPFHLKYFFRPTLYNQTVMRRRVTELLDLARKNEIGRPYALSEYRIARDLLTAPFIRNTEQGIAFSLYILRSLRNPAGAPPKEARLFFRILTSCYKDTLTPEYRKESLEQLIGFLKSRPPSPDYADELWSFLYKLEEKAREKPAPYIPHLPYDRADIKKMNTELQAYLCLRRKTGKGSYSEEELAGYLRRHGVRCPGDGK